LSRATPPGLALAADRWNEFTLLLLLRGDPGGLEAQGRNRSRVKRVLLTGASGLIGSAVGARLVREGHEVVAVVRPGSARAARPARQRKVALDIAQARRPEDWLHHLDGIDAVVIPPACCRTVPAIPRPE
jgi:nucleoside-diphosphate-sugar epimerase